MKSIAQNKRYLPHEISTKVQSVKLYRQTKDVGFVCRRYRVSKASLMRWNKLYDGTKESLTPKSIFLFTAGFLHFDLKAVLAIYHRLTYFGYMVSVF